MSQRGNAAISVGACLLGAALVLAGMLYYTVPYVSSQLGLLNAKHKELIEQNYRNAARP